MKRDKGNGACSARGDSFRELKPASTYKNITKKIKLSSAHWCEAGGQETVAINGNKVQTGYKEKLSS